ncbi:MAG: CvpA family protein [Syntrophomonadaceae bacterium]|nr:CvpA family protein [Syntrophomonadaceae bacterium]
MPFNGLDFIIAAIIIFSIISGMRHGLVIVLGEFIALLTALLLAIIFTGDVSQLLEDTLAVRTALEQFFISNLPFFNTTLPVGGGWATLDGVLVTPAKFFAHRFLAIVTFLLILFLGNKLLKLIIKALDNLLATGELGGLNAILGSLVAAGRNILILVLVLGFLYPLIYTAADNGTEFALILSGYIDNSILASGLLEIFNWGKTLFGMRA